MTNLAADFDRLCAARDLAAYRAVSTIRVVVDFWEAQDFSSALISLQRALADYEEADRRITQFRKSTVPSDKGEIARHGHNNHSAAS